MNQKNSFKRMRWLFGVGILTLILFPLAGGAIAAEKYPSKPILFIHGYGAGGTSDLQARLILPYVQKHLRQTVIFENLTGAQAMLATNKVFSSPPDGYTFLVANMPVLVMQEKYLPEIAKYVTRELSHVFSFVKEDFLLASHPEVWKNFAEFSKAAQSKRLRVGIPGKGTPGHLYAVMLEEAANVKYNIVPFEGGGPLRAALAGKHIDAVSTVLSGALPLIGGGILNPLVVLSDRRHPDLPETPTIVEATGVKSFEPIFYITGVFGPPNIPAARVKVLEEAFSKAVKEPEFLEKAKKMKMDIYPLNSQQLLANTEKQYIQVEKYIKILKSGN